ncbi:MAG: hypothetical protein GY757_13725, partial [bacterium]|nr:hypothetical protein [bacterium]
MKENTLITINKFKEAEEYWLDKLSGELNALPLKNDNHETGPYREANETYRFEETIEEGLMKISKNNNLSFYIILATALKIVLFKYTGQ